MFTKENISIVAVVVCLLATVYLYRELKELKNTPPQIMKVPYPVHVAPKPISPEQGEESKRLAVEEIDEEAENNEE
jgi:hypothetical protein